MALGTRGILRQVRDKFGPGQSLGYVTDSGVGHALNGDVFSAGSDLITSSDHVRGLLANPSGSGIRVMLFRVIIAHDQSGVLPGRFVREPDTNLPTTSVETINFSLAHGNAGQATVDIDSGAEMTGAVGGMFIPTTGSIPTDVRLTAPMIIPPGSSVGLDLDVGGTLSSGDVMMLVTWVEQAL